MKKELFGNLNDGTPVFAYTLEGEGASVTLLDYGATIQKLVKNGVDIVYGFDTAGGYEKDGNYMGATIGRYANRINNARFTLDKTEYRLSVNEFGRNQNHGGVNGFNRKMWDCELVKGCFGERALFHRVSEDGEEGWPGKLEVAVTYTLSGSTLFIRYECVSDKKTFVNMTNHAYFNLNGVDNSTICDHTLFIDADGFTEIDEYRIPTGRILPVEGNPFDFRTPKKIGLDIDGDHDQIRVTGGYGQSYVLNNSIKRDFEERLLSLSCELSNGALSLRIWSDYPELQLYTGNKVGGSVPLKGGLLQMPRRTVCLEPQLSPDGPNRGMKPLLAGEKYDHMIAFEMR